jgi:hypothetical protein
MELSPSSEIINHSTTHEYFEILLTFKVHYSDQQNLQMVIILSR